MTKKRRTLRTSWRLPRYKREWRSICAMLPKYLADGTNGTVIYYMDGSVEKVDKRLVWVLDDLLGHLGSSKELLHKKSLEYLEEPDARRLPLVVDDDFCLVPVKGRKTIKAADRAVGYIVLQYVQAVQTVEHETLVHLEQDNTIVVLDAARTVHQNLVLARALAQYQQPK